MASPTFNAALFAKAKEDPPLSEQAKALDPTSFIRLISSEGHVLIVEKECAKASKLIKNYLAGQQQQGNKDIAWDDLRENELRFPTTNAKLLEKAAQYFYYKFKYDNDPDGRPEFSVPPEMALDLIKVATLLQC